MSASDPKVLVAPDQGGFCLIYPNEVKIWALERERLSERDNLWLDGLFQLWEIERLPPVDWDREFRTWRISLNNQ